MIEQRHGGSSHKDNRPLKNAQKTLDEVYWPWSRDFRRYLAYLHLERHHLEDAIHAAWVAFFEKPPAFARGDAIPSEHLRRWLCRIAQRRAFDLLHALNSPPIHSLDAMRLDLKDHREDEAASLEIRQRERELLHLWLEELREIDPDTHRLLYGHCIEGRSVKDLAAENGLSPNAVSCRISAVRADFRARAAKLHEDDNNPV